MVWRKTEKVEEVMLAKRIAKKLTNSIQCEESEKRVSESRTGPAVTADITECCIRCAKILEDDEWKGTVAVKGNVLGGQTRSTIHFCS